jgi:hypothetical protein
MFNLFLLWASLSALQLDGTAGSPEPVAVCSSLFETQVTVRSMEQCRREPRSPCNSATPSRRSHARIRETHETESARKADVSDT